MYCCGLRPEESVEKIDKFGGLLCFSTKTEGKAKPNKALVMCQKSATYTLLVSKALALHQDMASLSSQGLSLLLNIPSIYASSCCSMW
jgi:hypothetical protein